MIPPPRAVKYEPLLSKDQRLPSYDESVSDTGESTFRERRTRLFGPATEPNRDAA